MGRNVRTPEGILQDLSIYGLVATIFAAFWCFLGSFLKNLVAFVEKTPVSRNR